LVKVEGNSRWTPHRNRANPTGNSSLQLSVICANHCNSVLG
jgi:type IV secretory pathway VirB2 component (pilin)